MKDPAVRGSETTINASPARPPGLRGKTSFSPGENVAERFHITRFLGEGGMGQVYEAEDMVLGGLVALKTIRPEISSDQQTFERFKQEVRLAKEVTHDNVCRVFDLDNHNVPPFITMELLNGETLSARLSREGKMTTAEALPLIEQIAQGLAAAHQKGIIHRDFKPGNVMLSRTGSGVPHAKVTDFGLARTIDDCSSMAPGIVGTPGYMAPEQLEGRRATVASDIYALGVVMYEMVTGARPEFQRLTETAPSPRLTFPDLDPMWEAAILRCLERDSERRFSSAAEVVRAIRGNAGRFDRIEDSIRRHPAALVAAGLAATLAILIPFLIPSSRPNERTVLTQVTADSGLATYPAVSADGKLVAYASDRSGDENLDIWLEQIGGGDPVRLTRDPSDKYAPSFSPDGTKVVFRSERDGGGIYSVPTLGGEPQLIARGGFGPRFSPDGKWIAYWVGLPGSGFVEGSSHIYLKPVGGGPTKLFQPKFAADFWPIWTPDSEQLLFVGRQNPRAGGEKTLDWWIASLDGSPAKRTGARDAFERYNLKAPVGQDLITPSGWDSAGDRVLFSAALGDSTNIWDVPLSAESGQVAGPVRRRTAGAGVELYASAVPDPRRNSGLCYSSEILHVDVWELPLDANQGKVLGDMHRLTQGLSYAASPSLSADGTKLAFTGSRSGQWSVRTRDLETGKEAVHRSSEHMWFRARISADGNKVAYVDNQNAMYLVDVTKGASEKICDYCGPPTDISPDGSRVLFEPLGPPENVMMIDVATHRIGDMVEHESQPDWILYAGRFSPDGHWIAFHAAVDRSLNKRIFITPMRDGHGMAEADWIPVTTGSNIDAYVSWSPDGSLLYFLSDRDGFRCIWAQPLDPITKRPVGKAFAVQHFHRARQSLMRLDRGDVIGVSVASGKLVFALGELSGNVWLSETKRGSESRPQFFRWASAGEFLTSRMRVTRRPE
jgi:eukaryotic-like serine/threonine-protein kinase